jgi:calmodulin
MKIRVPLTTIATVGSILCIANDCSSAFSTSSTRIKGANRWPTFVNHGSHDPSQDTSQSNWKQALSSPPATRPSALSVSLVESAADAPLPFDGNGLIEVNSPEQFAALLKYSHDKLLIVKVYAPWCRACKALEPKFLSFVNDPKFNENIPIVWAAFSIQHSKAFVKSLGVLALPTVQFYVGGQLTENFGCGPSKVPILKRKLVTLVNNHVDPITRSLKPVSVDDAINLAEQAGMRVKEAAGAATYSASSVPSSLADPSNYEKGYGGVQDSDMISVAPKPALTDIERKALFNIPYFREMSFSQFNDIVEKRRVLNFEPGHIIVRQGRPGRLFYVIMSGEVEIFQQTGAEDPMISTGYLGTVINRLAPYDYFGERSLITGEPRGATVRAIDPITIWAFDCEDFPKTSVLNGGSRGLEPSSTLLSSINDKYGIDVSTQTVQAISKQIRDASSANQVRGSVNNPYKMRGVDDDSVSQFTGADDNEQTFPVEIEEDTTVYGMPTINDDNTIFSLLTKFQAVQHIKTCFEYIQTTRARWGDDNTRKRRNLLVQRLSPSQKVEFSSNFYLIDANNDGRIELLEIKRVLDSIVSIDTDHTTTKYDDNEFLSNLMALGPKDQHTMNGQPYLTYEDYMGLMAEATFYQLFRSIFSSLDPNQTGYVKAYELDRVLCGVRDLISDDRKSVIDVDDQDMSIDYEQYARMLLGATSV